MERESGESKDCGGERCQCIIIFTACMKASWVIFLRSHTHIPHAPVWWRLFLLQIQLLVELHEPPLADLSSLQTGEGE